MKSAGEKILLYQFSEERLTAVKAVFKQMNIPTHVLRPDAFQHKIGYLLGLRGFGPTTFDKDAKFSFPHEVMVMHNIKKKRLDEVLQVLRDNDLKIPYKAVVTPFNTLWTLERLCETMEKEHAYMMARSENKAVAPANTHELLDANERETENSQEDDDE